MATTSDKQTVQLFVSYARANGALKTKLIDSLNLHLKLSRDFDFLSWQDSAIMMGEDWHEALDRALRSCTSGLCLLTPAFFSSDVIGKVEVPQLIDKPAGILPVLLEPLDFDNMDLGPFNARQVFTLRRKAFSQMRSNADRDEFVMALFKAIVATLKIRSPSSARMA
jgi:hypothetical protein